MQVKVLRTGATAKASLKWAYVSGARPEAEAIYPWSG
jgi:hypothetical protein